MALRQRTPVAEPESLRVALATVVSPSGRLWMLEGDQGAPLVLRSETRTITLGPPSEGPARLWATDPWVAVAYRAGVGCRVAVMDSGSLTVRLEVFLQGRQHVNVNLQEPHLVVVDDVGTVLVVDLENGAVLRDLHV